jgi:murein DD-endopeptidase MepM/ murein hydrolase activator NlpD
VRALRPPAWDWSIAQDGALALDRSELWDEPPGRPALQPSQARLNGSPGCATVPRMSPPAPGRLRSPRRQHLERERRRRRFAALIVVSTVAAVVVLLSAFGGSGRAPAVTPVSNSAAQLPAGPPQPEIVAKLGALHLQLPVNQSRVTAIGYAGGTEGAQALDPLGVQANQGLIKRVVHSLVGGSSTGPRWYQLAGGSGPSTSALDIGAPAGTDVYSPVDGTIVAIDRVILNGRRYGSALQIEPSGAPSLTVTVGHLSLDPALVVGSPVTSGGTRLGQVLDFSQAEHQMLSRYTNDSGNHVVVEVHPAATLQIP